MKKILCPVLGFVDIIRQMPEPDDHQLLAEFARDESQGAFAALVARYVNLVYSTAFRCARNPHYAEEISQVVFIILARKAGTISPRVVLSGWLYQATRLTAANFMKGEIRRQRREQEIYMQSTLKETNDSAWNEMAPFLDEAMGNLGQADRDAVVLRFFQNKSSAEIGAALRMTEETARRRVNRALDKLRRYFSKRGVHSTRAIIGNTISAHSVNAAPAGLAKTISAVAITKGVAASASTLTLIKGALKVMAWTKVKTAIAVGVGLLLVAGTATVTLKEIKAWRGPEVWQAGFDMSVLDRVPPQAKILPALSSRDPNINSWRGRPGDGKMMGLNDSAIEILSAAYGVPHARMIFLSPVPEGKFDFISNVSRKQQQALQQAIKKSFGLSGRYQLIQTNALEFVVREPAVALKRAASGGPEFSGGDGFIWLSNQPIANLAYFNEYFLGTPVVNRTRLAGYFDLKWDSNTTNSLQQAELENLGLELVPTNMPVWMLIVEKAK